MTSAELQVYLKNNYPQENEHCEWKAFNNLKHVVAGKAGEDIISYIAALANMGGGNLIIGVEDGSLNVIGIQEMHVYNSQNIKNKLLTDCVNLCSEGLTIEEHITSDTSARIWIFHIPKHPFRQPVIAHRQVWQRVGDSLVPMTPSRKEAILHEIKPVDDWTAVIVPEATLADLEPRAIEKARTEFIVRNPKYESDIRHWDDPKFLDKAKLTIKGRVTRTALILLGRDEAEHFLGSTVKIRWNLKTVLNEDKDFEIFSIPFVLAVDEVAKKIRNLRYRYLQLGTVFPEELLRYDPFSIREPLHNAIAHQDYTKGARINVVEFEDDHLVFSNYATFLPQSVEEVVLNDTPEELYRNPHLVEAMKTLNMIETQGGGIRKIFNRQRERLFPMPDYDLSNGKVKVTITGKILDENFARILFQNPSLTLDDILLLDKVQKHLPIAEDAFKYLKRLGFIEGRKSTPFLSHSVLKPVDHDGLKAEYIANRSFDDDYFRSMILEYLSKFGTAKRSALDTLIMPKLSAVLSEDQKKAKVGNLLSSLRIAGKINTAGYGLWQLCKNRKRV